MNNKENVLAIAKLLDQHMTENTVVLDLMKNSSFTICRGATYVEKKKSSGFTDSFDSNNLSGSSCILPGLHFIFQCMFLSCK